MTDRLTAVLKEPPKTWKFLNHFLNHDDDESVEIIDYPKWREQVIQAVEIDRKELVSLSFGFEYSMKEDRLTYPEEVAGYLIANKTRWLR